MKAFRLIFLAALLAQADRAAATDPTAAIAALERRLGGRIGVAAISLGTGQRIEYRAQEPFPMCSSFKFLLAAAVLKQSEKDHQPLSRRIAYRRSDLLPHSPVCEAHLRDGSLSVAELAAAAVEESDNCAANLLLKEVGAPAGLTRFIRSLGDPVTRLDRTEPTLNSAEPGDLRDTASPSAFAEDMKVLILGNALSPAARQTLTGWIVATTTGAKRIRAGLPLGWKVGDKTGTGNHGAAIDCAVLWPLGRPPIIVCAFLVGSSKPVAEAEAALAELGRIVAESAG